MAIATTTENRYRGTARKTAQGLNILRKFTKPENNPLEEVAYEFRSSIIRDSNGNIIKEIKNVEVPVFWSQVATDILAQKYLRKAGIPKDGAETSIKQVVKRLAGTWRWWGEKYGYFASSEDADSYQSEMEYMLIHQIAAPNSPQWFNTGLNWAYGITGNPQGHYYVNPEDGVLTKSTDAYSHPQPHACFIQNIHDNLVNDGGILDLVVREARLFKYGSGTGSNFSNLRAKGEKLSGGGASSGLMSFLRIFDRSAGAIQSGGTTRRAAKMVIVDADHPDIEEFINWKVIEEQKVAALVSGSRINKDYLEQIIKIATEEKTIDYHSNKRLKQVVKVAIANHIPLNFIMRALTFVEQGHVSFDLPVFSTHFEDEAYNTVSGQNSNNTVRVTKEFMQAVQNNSNWQLRWRTTGEVARTIKARDLWEQIAEAAWLCADPGLQFDTTINEWHTCPEDGRIRGSNPCSEYMFLDDTACNLASINLAHFYNSDSDNFDVDRFKHGVRLWTITLEISVLMAQFPSKEIAQRSFDYRTLGLGYANLGTTLMTMGIPYDSEKGRALAGAITAIMTGESYATSAEMAQVLGPFNRYDANKEHMLRVIRNHRRAAFNAPAEEYEQLSVLPHGINMELVPKEIGTAARECWDKALHFGEKFGYRNAQVTAIAPTGTIGLLMDCDTTGVEPDFALVKFKKLAGGGYFKIVNQSVAAALRKLGYTGREITQIESYCKGHGTLVGAPFINPDTLSAKGLTNQNLQIIESALGAAFDIRFVINPTTLGEETIQRLGLEDRITEPDFDLLSHFGFTSEQIQAANEYVAGTMTLEGAPYLKPEHYPIFDCANKCGAKGERYIAYTAHVDMMAAVQPFISGAISKTVNMPAGAKVEEVKQVYQKAWQSMVKAVALYRDGSKLSQPLNTLSVDDSELFGSEKDDINEVRPQDVQAVGIIRGMQEKLTPRRNGWTQQAVVGGHKIYVRTGEYADGRLGEVFIDMYKDGAAYRSLLNCFAISVSKGLQYGIPLEEYVDTFTFTRFEPGGAVQGHDNIKMSTSILDYVFRLLGFEYLGRNDLVQIKPTAQTLPLHHPVTVSHKGNLRENAKVQGFTGDSCSVCGSMKMKRNGSCMLCLDCGTTTGCS